MTLRPQLFIMYKAEKFWDRLAKRYEKSPVSDKDAYQKKLEMTRAYFTPDSQVLEFGCGTGTTAVSHAPFVGHLDGIDISSKMLEFAKAKAQDAGINNVTFTCANIDDFSSEKPYDVVMGHSILHLLNDKEMAIKKVFSLLKPGGIFVSSTTCVAKNRPIVNSLLTLGRKIGLLPLVKLFHVDDLTKALNAAGFEIVKNWRPKGGSAVFIVAQKPD